ncbi:MAG: AlpA family phage regulatory protein [Nitrospinae bacterium]|nr:AlpA family phage regulatory protein [Nitrospinota bacterium]
MRAADVELAVGLSRVTIWRLEREEKFPARVQVSPSRVGWHGHEIKKWINTRPRVDLEPCEGKAQAV